MVEGDHVAEHRALNLGRFGVGRAQLAEDEGFDLVVVGCRGRNAVARMFLGAVADRLVHVCKKPVLVVR